MTYENKLNSFWEKGGKLVLEFHSGEWMQDLAFMVDVTEHLNTWNKQLQGRNISLEIIDLQCDSGMKGEFAADGLDAFYQNLAPGYLSLTALAAKLLSMFGTTYLCEQVFSVMSSNKTKLRSRLTHILKLAVTQNATSDFIWFFRSFVLVR